MTSPAVRLDWRQGQIRPLAPCVLCGLPALCWSLAKEVPCHKGCAGAWIAVHARELADLGRLVRQATSRGRSS